MPKRSAYDKKLRSQDPNKAWEFETLGCRTTNDYRSWDELHGEVLIYNIKDSSDGEHNGKS